MKKLLSLAVATALLSSVALAGSLTITGTITEYATVAFGGGPLTTDDLRGENHFNTSTLDLGAHAPAEFGATDIDVFAITNSDDAGIELILTGEFALSDDEGNTIPMSYSYRGNDGSANEDIVSGAVIPLTAAIGAANQGQAIGVFTAAPTDPIPYTQPAGDYSTRLLTTVSAV